MSRGRGVGVGGDDSTMLAQAPWSVAGHAMQPWQLDDPARGLAVIGRWGYAGT